MNLHELLCTPEPAETICQEVENALAVGNLHLGREEILDLAEQRARALRDTELVELGCGILPHLARRLAASPLRRQEFLASDLGELQDAFYFLRDEVPCSVPDLEIVDAIMDAFENSGGSAEEACALCGRDVLLKIEHTCRCQQKESAVSSYEEPLTDEQGRVYRRLRSQWDNGEFCPGWGGEPWDGGDR